MEKKNTLLLTVIAIATLLIAVVGATFAYFASNINTNNNIAVNVNTSNNQAIFIASTEGNINLNVESYMMQQGDVDENGLNTSGVETIANNLTSSAKLNVTLQASEDEHETTCSYNIVYTWDEASASNFPSQSSVAEQSGGVDNTSKYYKSKYYVRSSDGVFEGYKELTVEIDSDSGVGTPTEPERFNTLVPEVNIDTFKLDNNSDKIILKQGETISSQSTTQKSYTNYLITFKFYNLENKQNTLMGKTFSGKISVENVVC